MAVSTVARAASSVTGANSPPSGAPPRPTAGSGFMPGSREGRFGCRLHEGGNLGRRMHTAQRLVDRLPPGVLHLGEPSEWRVRDHPVLDRVTGDGQPALVDVVNRAHS